MKILFLAHRAPYPPDKGDKIRSFHLLSHLAKTHDVTLLYWVDDPRDLVYAEYLQSLCRGKVFPLRLHRLPAMLRAVLSLLKGGSFSEGFYLSRSFQHAVAGALRNGPFDALFIFSSAMASYGKKLDAKIKLVDFVDVDSDKWRQLAEVSRFPLSILYRLEQRRLARLEVETSSWASRSLFVSPADAELFKRLGGEGSIEVLPNGAELDLKRLPLEQIPFHAGDRRQGALSVGARILFVGMMNYYPNVDAVGYFAENIFPLVRQNVPCAIFEIVGRNPSKAVRRLAKLDGVRVIGEVGDIRSHLLRADVSVAPIRIARGVQNKVLEAMALGVPVVTTSAAIQGIEVYDGQEVLVGDSPEDFARQVVRVLSDSDLRKAITKKARTKMKQFYSWESVGAKLDRLLSTAPGNEAPAPGDAEMSIRQG